MSRENDDNLSSINSAYTDMYQETVKRFTRSSLSPEMDRYSSSSPISTKSNSKKSSSPKLGSPDRRLSFDLYVEATGRRRSSDHGAVLTVDTEQFIIGQRVWVGGVRPGQIAYIGETHFAPGEWAGVVLDEPNGKNDGCVSGKRYFQCEPKRGIFSRLTRLTLSPLPGAITPSSPLSKYTPDRSRTVSPTASVRSSALRSPIGKNGLTVGDRVIVSSGFGSRPGILRYLGETRFAPGNWCGVELDEPTGKNDGSVDGFRYFECQPKYGVFVPIAKVSLSPSSKKSRLSRAGSRESLTSIGTMNSVATTNTSRLRMSAQRKPSLIKPVSTPKSQFSMQDLLREKQNHIEQLMIERDLDREDAQNQALQFQKNISELQTRIHELERRLTDERKKTEDLQFSVDEATFCGDELNAQTQVYKEKIHDLEQTILQLSTSAPHHSILDPSIKNQAAENAVTVEVADEQISQLKTKLNEQAFAQEAQVAAFREEEKRLQDNIKYLQDQNEILQRELLEKDASLEKFSLSESGMENLRIELELLKQENERERQQIYAEYEQMLKASKAQVKELQEKLTAQSSTLANLEGERTNIEDECEILRAECKAQNKQLQDFTDQLLKAQQLGNAEGRSSLDEQIAEITKLKEKIDSLESVKMTLEADLQNSQTQLIKLREEQQQSEELIRESAICNEEKSAAIKKLEAAMDELKQQVGQTEGENQKILVELKNLTELKADLLTAQNELKKQLEEKTKALEVTNLELQQAKEAIECLQQQLTNVNAESHKALTIKNTEVQSLTEEIKSLTEKAKAFESNSSTMVQQMSAKIQELEAQIKDLQQSLKSSEAELENQRLENKKHEDTIAEKLAELAKASKELESTTSLLEKLQEDNTSVQIKCSELQQELKQSYERNTHLELAVSDSRRKYKALNIKCDNYASQTESLQQDLLSIRSTSVEMQATMRNLNEELAARQKSFDELQNDSNAERFKLENRIEELQQKLIGSNKDFEELKENLQKTKEELSKRNEIITNLEEKTVKQELSLSDALRLQENLQTKYEALVAQNSSLQNDLTSLRSSSTDSNAELVKLSQDVAVKQRAYEELLDKSSSERSILESQLQASQQRVDTLCNQVEALTQELKATTEESFKRFEQLKQAEEKNSKQELELADAARKLDALEAKSLSLEAQNESLQKDLNVLRADSTDSSSAMLKLSEEVAKKQKALQEYSDKASAENLQRETQIQELTMRFESAQAEINSLRKELQSAEEEKAKQVKELESKAAKVKIDAEREMQSVQDKAAKERKGLCESFERQLKVSEENKIALDGTILQLEQQIQLLQYDLLRSQLDFQVKEEEHATEAKAFVLEIERLNAMLQQMHETGETRIKEVQEEKAELIRSLQQLNDLLQQKEETLLKAYRNAEDIKLAQANSTEEIKKLEAQMKVLESTLEKTTEQLEHRTKLADNDKKEADELKAVMKTLQTSNVRMSITNADLSAALKKIESEKFETTHNFELFEIESDQNATQLRKAHARLEEELSMKQQLLEAKDATLIVTQNRIEELTAQLEISQIDLNAEQAQTEAHAEMLAVLQQASEENTEALTEQEAQIQRLNATESNNQEILRQQEKLIGALRTQLAELKSSGPISVEQRKREELELQLTEYRKIVEELDEASEEKTLKLIELQKRVNQLEQAKQAAQTDEQLRAAECVSLLNKLEKLEEEKLREVVALQKRINELQSANTNGKVKENGMETLEAVETNGTSAQINFLNSIIADMQKKNDMLKAKIEALENCSDFTQPHAFDIIAKRKPAPRAFCDICDIFDQHETEDCPLQASSDREYSPPPFKLANPESNNNDTTKSKERKLPEPRKYCESCEVFGHETGECNDECY